MTTTHLVLTAIGADRPGLVNALSDTIAAGGGNWLDARMQTLAGQFAGILLVAVEASRADALAAALAALQSKGLRVVVEKAGHGAVGGHEPSVGVGNAFDLELVGHDRPGIVRDISRVLTQLHVSIVEFETERASGSFSGEAMFKARARLQAPPTLALDDMKRALEELANELMVDLSAAEQRAQVA
jgi:glycine cleavage system regulatory protein